MPNPFIASTLVERGSAPRGNNVPRGSVILITGPAESGPIAPVRVDNPEDAYERYGEGELARAVDLAHAGARFATGLDGSSDLPNVFALRVRTGTSATIELTDAQSRPSITLTTVEHSRSANEYKIADSRYGYKIMSPRRETATVISVDKLGLSATQASSPSQFAAAIRQEFAGELTAEVHPLDLRFEISVDDTTPPADTPTLTVVEGEQVIDFTGTTDVALDGIQIVNGGGALYTMVGREAQTDFTTGTGGGLYNSIFSAGNDDAIVYALTAGKAVEIPQGTDRAQVEKLGDAKRIGFGDTNSLLNIRSTGDDGAVTLAEAGQDPVGTKASEAYWRVRKHLLGNLSLAPEAVTSDYDFGTAGDGSTDADAYTFAFTAPAGVAGVDPANHIADYQTAGPAYSDRLGTPYSYEHPDIGFLGLTEKYFRLDLASLDDPSDPVSVPLQLEDYTTDNGTAVRAEVVYEGSDAAKLYIHKADFDALFGLNFEDALVYASYDSYIFKVKEKSTLSALAADSGSLDYFVSDNEIIFNKALDHTLAVRGLRITQYRFGSDVVVERTTDGANKFRFVGEDQPGEAGGTITDLETIFGVKAQVEPGWPVLTSPISGDKLSGGSPGTKVDAAAVVRALEETLSEFRSDDVVGGARFIVPVGVHFDSVQTDYDPQTGTRIEKACDLVGALDRFRQRVDSRGASGLFYLSAKPMKPASTTGRYTDDQIVQRFIEHTVVDATDAARSANVVNSDSYPQFGFFDAPAEVVRSSRQFTMSMVPFFVGMRSILRNTQALYNLSLPNWIRPLYKFNVVIPGSETMTDRLAVPGRINAWDPGRGVIRLADERSGAGFFSDPNGNLVPSDLQSMFAVLAVNEFRQNVLERLELLRGPMTTSVGVLRTRIQTALDDEVSLVDGIDGLYQFDPNVDIDIYDDGGKAIGIIVNVTVQTLGELREIQLNVGSTGPDLGLDQTVPVAG